MESQNTVLFFGRHNCPYSDKVCKYLKKAGFDVTSVFSKKKNEKLPEHLEAWSGDYIFSFRSYFFLPKWLLEKASKAAINFHPGPPEYPGSGCTNWALYDDAKEYGATAHIMNEKIDNGAIIECYRFPILPEDNIETLLQKTHLKTYALMMDILEGLVAEGFGFLDSKLAASKHEKWHGQARKIHELDQLQIIDPAACDEKELKRIIRATYTPEFPPEIRLHGYRFILKKEKALS